MALLDYFSTIADGVAISTSAPATSKFGNEVRIDANNVYDTGAGEPFFLNVDCDLTATSGGAATLQLELVTADNAALTTNVRVLMASQVYALASLVGGTRLFTWDLPRGITYRNFIGLRQVVGTAAFTAGRLNAYFTQVPQNWRAYPNNLQ